MIGFAIGLDWRATNAKAAAIAERIT